MSIEDELREHRENKTRYHDDIAYTEGNLAWLNFCTKNQLRKGNKGEYIEGAEYYWSEHEGVTHKSGEHRYPIIRTELARPTKPQARRNNH